MSTSSNNWGSSSGSNQSAFSNTYRDQVNRSKDVFSSNNAFGSNNAYANKNIWRDDNPYKTENVYGSDDDKTAPKYKRFSDLKILNENMMHMSNNTLPEESRIEILSQGEKGEIKNVLSYRIFQIAFVPALSSLAFGLLIIFTNSVFITMFGLFVYLGILVRTFFYPAKLYYENIKYKTTKPARAFFEEMDYWYKISVVNIYIYLVITSIFLFVASFYQDDLVTYLYGVLDIDMKTTAGKSLTFQEKIISNIEFSTSLKVLALFNIVLLVIYARFANKEKSEAEKVLKERMRLIRNESLSRYMQVQEDKNSE